MPCIIAAASSSVMSVVTPSSLVKISGTPKRLSSSDMSGSPRRHALKVSKYSLNQRLTTSVSTGMTRSCPTCLPALGLLAGTPSLQWFVERDAANIVGNLGRGQFRRLAVGGRGGLVVAFRCRAFQEPQQLDRERQDERGVLLGGDLDNRLQQAQLQGRRLYCHHRGGLGELLGRLQLAVGGDDAGPALTLGPGLPGDPAPHRVGEHDVLDLDSVDVDTPAQRWAVDQQLEGLVETL